MSKGPLALCAVMLTGCLVGMDEGPKPGTLAAPGHNKLALNKLALNKLALNKLALNKLALNGLADSVHAFDPNSGLAEMEELSREEDGRSETVTYVVKCLARPGQTVSIEQTDGSTHDYDGEIGIGLASLEPDPTAADSYRCGQTCQEWMTSCLLAHVNALGVSVEISLRGPHETLAPAPVELADFVEQEAGFFGNLFEGQSLGDPNAPLVNIYSCTGWLWDDGAQTVDTKRLCGSPVAPGGSYPGCGGIKVVGYCGAHLPGAAITPRVCDQQITGAGGTLSGALYYSDCYQRPGFTGFPRSTADGPAHRHVITTHLLRRCDPAAGIDDNPRCDLDGKRGTCVEQGDGQAFCREFQ